MTEVHIQRNKSNLILMFADKRMRLLRKCRCQTVRWLSDVNRAAFTSDVGVIEDLVMNLYNLYKMQDN